MSVCILQPCIAGWLRPSLLEEKEAVSHPHPHPLASSLFALDTDNCVIVIPSEAHSKPVLNWKECEGEVITLFPPGIGIQGQHSIARPLTRRRTALAALCRAAQRGLALGTSPGKSELGVYKSEG